MSPTFPPALSLSVYLTSLTSSRGLLCLSLSPSLLTAPAELPGKLCSQWLDS